MRVKKQLVATLLAVGLFASAVPMPSFAVTAEEILEVLVNKGIISRNEYVILLKGPGKATAQPEAQGAKPSSSDQSKKAEPVVAQPETKPSADTIAGVGELTANFKDGVSWESKDKSTMISLHGRILPDYRNFLGNDAIGADTFDMRQAQLWVDGRFYDDYEFRVRAEYSSLAGPLASVCTSVIASGACTTTQVPTSQSAQLFDAYINYAGWKAAQIRFGQLRVPYSFELLEAVPYFDFYERSFAGSFDPSFDRGVMVHGSPIKGLWYGLSYTNGNTRNVIDSNEVVDSKDTSGRLAVNFAELFDHKDAIYHLGLNYTRGRTTVAGAVPGVRTEARGARFFVPLDFTADDVVRTRAAVEGVIAYGPVKFASEYFNFNYSGETNAAVPTSFDRDIKIYYLSLLWLITGEHYADFYNLGRMGRLRPTHNVVMGKSCCGAWELGLRYSKFDASDFPSITSATSNPGTGAIRDTGSAVANAWTLGVKWILNPNTRLLLNYTKTDFGKDIRLTTTGNPSKVTDTREERAITVRGSFDF
ncbi:MAG: porin [Burkholderiales bacterium]